MLTYLKIKRPISSCLLLFTLHFGAGIGRFIIRFMRTETMFSVFYFFAKILKVRIYQVFNAENLPIKIVQNLVEIIVSPQCIKTKIKITRYFWNHSDLAFEIERISRENCPRLIDNILVMSSHSAFRYETLKKWRKIERNFSVYIYVYSNE